MTATPSISNSPSSNSVQPQTFQPSATAPQPAPVPPASSTAPATGSALGDRLVKARLGVYTGLYYAIRAKHAPTAAHALRVAIGCSKWATWKEMNGAERDVLEVAALLHDIGKIGVPDQVLQKPERLDSQELLMIDMQAGVGQELLQGAGAGPELLEIVANCRKSFDQDSDMSESARMLAIVDAFDAMTTEQVFRRAISRERAIEELCVNAGTQFDPKLVREFAELISQPRKELESAIGNRWLSELYLDSTAGFSAGATPPSCGAVRTMLDTLFHYRLLETARVGTVYLDSSGQVLQWNRATEELTGRSAASVMNRLWTAELMGLYSEEGEPLEECPLVKLRQTNTQLNQRLQVTSLDGKVMPVQFTATPVFSKQKSAAGVILTFRDASQVANLEKRVESLTETATQDPLTKVANRAALNTYLPQFFEDHISQDRRGSLIICDIDYFKRINDTHGHQAGDEALVTFAAILSENARSEDMVARYGGEEFVLLCADCDNPSATSRAEQIRQAVESTPVPSLGGNPMTASFGVTEIQPGDDAETVVARADRALLEAKESGRNRVVQLGSGQDAAPRPQQVEVDSDAPPPSSSWFSWAGTKSKTLAQAEYISATPKEVAIQKLQGFIHDHKAELVKVKNSDLVIRVSANRGQGRRQGERSAAMILEVKVQTVDVLSEGRKKTYQSRTRFIVTVRPLRARDRRISALCGQAKQLLASFQAYLVAQEVDEALAKKIIEPR